LTTFFAFLWAPSSNNIQLTASEKVRTRHATALRLRRHDDVVICTYRLAKFGGDMVIDIMQTHPVVIIGRILQQNPIFVPPEEFLREVCKRRTKRTASTPQAV
jgi:hypothetical protein